MLDGLEEESVLRSIYAKLLGNDVPPTRVRVNSSSSDYQQNRGSVYKDMSCPTSGISFAGLDKYVGVPSSAMIVQAFYPPPANTSQPVPHRRHKSVFSIVSVSSYGHVINSGSADPFEYGLPSFRERPLSEDISSISRDVCLCPRHFCPLSVLSIGSVHSPADDDDTMIGVSSFKPRVYLTEFSLDARRRSRSAPFSWLHH